MRKYRPRRDNNLIDAVEAHDPVAFEGNVWRVAHYKRLPDQCSRSGGRWDDSSFDVLYTACESDGAMAEMYFHLAKGQPVFPSKVRYHLHEIQIKLGQALKLVDLQALTDLKVDTSRYGRLSYQERVDEYPRTQDIAEVAHFLDFDGLIAPSARWNCSNVVIFCDRVEPSNISPVKDHGKIDWNDWARKNT